MLFRDLPVFFIPGLLGSPVEKGEIQKTVNDKPVILRLVHGPPGLDKLPDRVETGDQLVRCLHSRTAYLICFQDVYTGCRM